MIVSATELKANIDHYLNAVSEDEVLITENGKIVAKLSANAVDEASKDKQAILDSLVGITAEYPVSLEEAKMERLSRQ